ncbi:hypothetical protein, partial [Phocaeicola dorei]|uniref:hypothetical protein n=4 Tax=Phocaeicola dorei TaxID=357276 RepID=UPI001BDF1153
SLKLFCNTLNHRCVTKKVFITEDTGGKRQTHYNIRTRVNKNGRAGTKERESASPEGQPNTVSQDREGKTATENTGRCTQHTQLS